MKRSSRGYTSFNTYLLGGLFLILISGCSQINPGETLVEVPLALRSPNRFTLF
jgi:hypothetical protein